MIFVGLDISKKFIDVCIKCNEVYTYKKIDNEIKSIKSFIKHLLSDYQKEDLFACCEYTNIYYLDIANELYKSGIQISVENAVSINYFARAQLSRIKTDKSDSKLIADYCSIKKPRLWHPVNQDIRVVRNITKRIEQMQKIQTVAKNQHKTASAEVINSCIERFQNSKKLVSYLGLSPMIRQSSSSVRGKTSSVISSGKPFDISKINFN